MRGKGAVKISWILLLIILLGFSVFGCGQKPEANKKGDGSTDKKAIDYPNKAVQVIVPFGAGGGTDVIARILAEKVQPILGQPAVVVNKPGGGGNIGWTETANSKPDGYTIAMSTPNICMNKALGISQIDINNFTPVAAVVRETALIIVHKNAPWKNFDELMKFAKENPGKLKVGIGSTSNPYQFGVRLALKRRGAEANFVTGGAGGAQIGAQLMGGHIDVTIQTPSDVAGQLQSGEIKALAAMGNKRLEWFPDVPTLKELGYDYAFEGYRGVVAPKGTPQEVIEVLAKAIKKVVESPDYKATLEKQYSFADYLGSDEYLKVFNEQQSQFDKLVAEFGLKENK